MVGFLDTRLHEQLGLIRRCAFAAFQESHQLFRLNGVSRQRTGNGSFGIGFFLGTSLTFFFALFGVCFLQFYLGFCQSSFGILNSFFAKSNIVSGNFGIASVDDFFLLFFVFFSHNISPHFLAVAIAISVLEGHVYIIPQTSFRENNFSRELFLFGKRLFYKDDSQMFFKAKRRSNFLENKFMPKNCLY